VYTFICLEDFSEDIGLVHNHPYLVRGSSCAGERVQAWGRLYVVQVRVCGCVGVRVCGVRVCRCGRGSITAGIVCVCVCAGVLICGVASVGVDP
jgi:hypothetical protein